MAVAEGILVRVREKFDWVDGRSRPQENEARAAERELVRQRGSVRQREYAERARAQEQRRSAIRQRTSASAD